MTEPAPRRLVQRTEGRTRLELGGIRQRRAKGEPVWYLVPDGVVQYISKYDLYGDEA